MLSSCTENIPPKFTAPYVTTKYALLGMMKALATEYDSKDITINGISPEMMKPNLGNIFNHVIEENAQKSPFGRNLYIDEVVPTVEYILSDGVARITGQNIIIFGGM